MKKIIKISYRNKSGFTREDVQEFYLRKNVLCDEMEKKYEVLASYIKNHYLYISLKKKKRELKKLKSRNERIYYILRKTYFNWTLIQQAVLSHRFSPVLEYSPIGFYFFFFFQYLLNSLFNIILYLFIYFYVLLFIYY